jgi:hypothetical protein
MSAAVGGAEFHGFRGGGGGAAQLQRSRMLGRPLRVATPHAAAPAGGGGSSSASIRAVSAVSFQCCLFSLVISRLVRERDFGFYRLEKDFFFISSGGFN